MSEAAAPPGGEGAFSPRTVIALLIAGVFAFSALVVVSAYAPDLRGGSDGGGHALSKSAVGYAGMVRLLKAMGEPVVVSRDPKAQAGTTSLLVLTPDPGVDKAALNAIIARGQGRGPILIVMPKWQAIPDQTNPGWVVKVGPTPVEAVAKVLDQSFDGVKMVRETGTAPVQLHGLVGGPMVTGPIDQLQAFVDDPDIFVRDAHGEGVMTKEHTKPIYQLSDPDLLNTQGIKDLATARAGVALINALRRGDGPIVFDVSLNGFERSRNLLRLAFDPPFLGATLCLAAAALLMALQALTRFGAPRRAGRAIALGKLALADNSAGLIRLARREPKMAGRYLDLTRASVARALGAGRLDESALAALLDRQAERVGAQHRLAGLTADAAGVKDRAGLMRLARNLYQWRTEMISGRR
jgi:hypothetical protein